MKFFKIFVVLLCVLSGAALFYSAHSFAHELTGIKPVRNAMALADAKRAGRQFKLLTPEEAEQFRTSAAGDPCNIATPIEVGQSIGNALNNTDCQLDDGSWADFYTFNGTAGQQITLSMNPVQNLDPYLGLANESGTFVVEDDDSGGGTAALITTTLPETGTYIILANSALPNDFGGYILRLSGALPCSFVLSPTGATVPGPGGTFTFDVITQPGCQWQAESINNFSTTTSTGTGNGSVTYTVLQNGSGSTRTGSIRVAARPFPAAEKFFAITQPTVACPYQLQPSSVTIPGTQTSGSFNIVTPAGCPWTAQSNYSFITVSASGSGNGTINYAIRTNVGADRVATITVGGQTFTINQTGLNCTYTLTPPTVKYTRNGGSGSVTVNTQAGCTWFATESSTFVAMPNSSGSGSATLLYTVDSNAETLARSAAIQFQSDSSSFNQYIDQLGRHNNPDFDFSLDGRSDLAVFRPSSGKWYMGNPTGGYTELQWGSAGDKLAPADFNGNGATDPAIFRDGVWYIWAIPDGPQVIQFGAAGDIPVPADYDNDGIDDIAVYRPANGVWYIRSTFTGQVTILQFGIPGDVPTVGDFDGDGRSDIAVWRPSTGVWYRQNSSNGSFGVFQFGLSEDKPVPADYDGDGKTDIAVYRPSEGVWYRINSSDNSFTGIRFGLADDLPVVADYDGDRKADIALFRPATADWHILQSRDGYTVRSFGSPGDRPAANAFIR